MYVKEDDLVAYLSIPATYVQVKDKMLAILNQVAHDMIRYVIGKDLGNAFIADLDTNGNPQAIRFVNLNAILYPCILHLSIVSSQPHWASIASPVGNVAPEKNQQSHSALDYIWNKGVELGIDVRNYICKNSNDYPEYCSCCVQPFKKSIF